MGLSVLLVEDSPLLRATWADLLAEHGCEVVATLPSEAAALEWLSTGRRVDLAIIDLVLETGTGMRVIAACRDAGQAERIAVYSAYVTADVERHCRTMGADAVFDKAGGAGALVAYCQSLTVPWPQTERLAG